MRILLLMAYLFHQASADSHSLKYWVTVVTPGISFPEVTVTGEVDIMQAEYFDDNIRKLVPKTNWIKMSVKKEDWETRTLLWLNRAIDYKSFLKLYMKTHHHTEGLHTFQVKTVCQQDDQNKTGFDISYAYDGADVISQDTNDASGYKTQAITLNMGDGSRDILDNDCTETLNKYIIHGREILERKDPPSVTVFQKNSSSPVVCHATSFFPKKVFISWQRNKKYLHKDVELKETLPNEDYTFQKRSNLRVSPEELQNNKYTCVVQHISLKEPFEVDVPKNQGPDRKLGIILGVVTVCFCIGVFGFWIKKKNMPGDSPDENASEHIRIVL